MCEKGKGKKEMIRGLIKRKERRKERWRCELYDMRVGIRTEGKTQNGINYMNGKV